MRRRHSCSTRSRSGTKNTNPRKQATDRLEGRYEARVLEPSPPAVQDEPWFADDPVAIDDAAGGLQVVSPVTNGDVLWRDLAEPDPSLSEWCSERWLGPYKRLQPAPVELAATRLALHRLAERVISPTRARANGKIGLRWTRGGFGTPYFGADAQVRVEGADLVIEARSGEQRHPLTTVRDAAAAIGFDLEGADEEQAAAPLAVDDGASRFVGDWFGFATSVLEQLRAEAPGEWEPSRVQIWPEHFDVAVEMTVLGTTLGASPGDELHSEPYLYATLWEPQPPDALWNAQGFPGAELPYSELLAAPDQRGAALDFFRVRLARLSA